MYSSFPIKTDIIPNVMNQGVQFDFVSPNNADVPLKCNEFLTKLGWSVGPSNHPDTGEMLLQKKPPDDASDETIKGWNPELQYCYWHWYEAMAYEFAKFMGIGVNDVEAAIEPAGAEGVTPGSGGREA